jgi:hypothetical protein
MWYRISLANLVHNRLFFACLMSGFFFSANSKAKTPSLVRSRLSAFHASGEDANNLVDKGIEHKSGLITRKSAKYSTMDLTIS